MTGVSRVRTWLLAAALLSALCQQASAIVLDWDSVTWNPGSLANSFDIDPASPGTDVSISITGNTNTFTNDSGTGIITPAITQTLTGGLSPAQNSLQLAANLKTNSDLFVNINFSSQYALGVVYVSLTLFDIDEQTNNDRVSGIYGIGVDGTHIAAVLTNIGPSITVTGSGLGVVLTGSNPAADNSSDGNVTISFGGTPITAIVFDYNNTNGAPKYQHIALGDLTFVPVPEAKTAAVTAGLCAAAIVVELRRRRVRVARLAG